MNKPAFVFKKDYDNHSMRTFSNDLVSTASVFGTEGGLLQAKISASVAKKRAFDTINQANIFLLTQKNLERTVDQCMLNENISEKKYVPICLLETLSDKSQIYKNVFQPDYLEQLDSNEIFENFKNQNWTNITKEKKENIQRYFNTEVSNSYSSDFQHSNRVKEMIMKFFDVNSIKSM